MASKSYTSFIVISLIARAVASCLSYGVDFQDGGSYFQNINSTDPFSFVSQFSGCQNDTAYNVLVDPDGDQEHCSDTNLVPDSVNQLSTCVDLKSSLFSGEWSIVILSNNGNGDPIAYQRDFYLSVGPQVTTTYTPSIVISTTTTPLTTSTSTTTYTNVTSAPQQTTTIPSTTITQTYTVTPNTTTTTSTKTLFTLTLIKPSITIVKTTKIITPSCHSPTIASSPDKTATIPVTLSGAPAQSTHVAKLRFLKNKRDTEILDKKAFIEERRSQLEARRIFDKRAPDAPTVTITDTNTSDYATVTSTSTAPTITATVVATTTVTSTFTPAPATKISGQSTAPAVTTTLATPTRTLVRYTIQLTTLSTTFSPTITYLTRTTPASVSSACKTAGGILY